VNKRRSEQLAKIAASALRPDEAIEFLTIAKVGTPSRKKQAWVLLCFKGSEDRLRLAFGQQQRKDANALAAGIGIN